MKPRRRTWENLHLLACASLLGLGLVFACTGAELSSDANLGSANGNAMDSGPRENGTELSPTHSEGTPGSKYDPNPDAGFHKSNAEKTDAAALPFHENFQFDFPEGADPIHDSIENGGAPSADELATIKIPQKR